MNGKETDQIFGYPKRMDIVLARTSAAQIDISTI